LVNNLLIVKIAFFLLFITTSTLLNAQNFLKPGKYQMSYSFTASGGIAGSVDVDIDISTNNDEIALYTTLHINGLNSVDTSIAKVGALVPVYQSLHSKNHDYVFHYGKEISGYYLDKQSGKKTEIRDYAPGELIDGNFYQYYIASLPLAPGYKGSMNIYEYKINGQPSIKKMVIKEVKDNLYTSNITGIQHKVWQVSSDVAGNKDGYVYYIDKDTRRIWKVEFVVDGKFYLLEDKEIEYNPYHTTFNKDETLKMLNDGKSTISGVAFARDNNGSGISVLNVQKKQYAPAGTVVTLIPYTDFFKEWVELSDAAIKKGKQRPPLPKGADECIKSTTVSGNEGQFEFTNLTPGDYLLVTQLTFVHPWETKEVTSYTNTYVNGSYVSSAPSSYAYHHGANLVNQEARKVVIIKTDGEKAEVKLKRIK